MALEEYKRKRDFARTPEPAGDTKADRKTRKGKPLFFCVQKHLASHLHYDLRLEHKGVLMSWAVPKGPSLDPKTKRLAMHVEDHPIEYGTFEGVIPEGYGAGIVMLWDQGSWEPESEDIDKALAKGDLKFKLDGYKLKGSWVLVQTRGYSYGRSSGAAAPGERGSSRSWLLIKHRDDWSGDVDIAEFAPLSVKSGMDFPEILAADNPEIWRTNRPVEGGETGALLKSIIAKAAELKAERAGAKTGRTITETAAPPREARRERKARAAPKARKSAGVGPRATKK